MFESSKNNGASPCKPTSKLDSAIFGFLSHHTCSRMQPSQWTVDVVYTICRHRRKPSRQFHNLSLNQPSYTSFPFRYSLQQAYDDGAGTSSQLPVYYCPNACVRPFFTSFSLPSSTSFPYTLVRKALTGNLSVFIRSTCRNHCSLRSRIFLTDLLLARLHKKESHCRLVTVVGVCRRLSSLSL